MAVSSFIKQTESQPDRHMLTSYCYFWRYGSIIIHQITSLGLVSQECIASHKQSYMLVKHYAS
uniref:Uncharacterized protein n=1 Tax=Arundo donax TaxID=35708 RepID=A0A0A9E8D5_ARUDO